MGCDIHLYTERRDDSGSSWDPATVRVKCSMCGRGGKPVEPDCYWCKGTGCELGFGDRNYELFSMLAGVRNYSLNTPIAEPRGLPSDLSAVLQPGKGEFDDDAWFGDHSFSHLYLRELLDDLYWAKISIRSGVVSLAELKRWIAKGAKGSPESWCASVGGAGVRMVPFQLAREIAAACEYGESSGVWENIPISHRLTAAEFGYKWQGFGFEKVPKHGPIEELLVGYPSGAISIYTEVIWHQTYRDGAGRFLTEFVPELMKLGSPDDVRIVFGFDS